jgi:hypothetical protein
MRHGFRYRAPIPTILLTVAMVPLAREGPAPGPQRTPSRASGGSTIRTGDSAKEAPVPFATGEKLEYTVSWASFTTAASAELSIPEQRDLYGWQTWHFRASAHTAGTVRTLFPIDDELDSYTDARTLESREYESYLNEMGRRTDRKWQFVPEGEKARAPGPFVIVLPGTRDPLGALYALRSVDWQHENEIRVPVYDGHRVYEMRATMEAASEPVEVPAGSFSTTRIGIQVFQDNAEVSGVQFTVWLAGDAAHTPVQMRGELPFGTLRVEMTAATR